MPKVTKKEAKKTAKKTTKKAVKKVAKKTTKKVAKKKTATKVSKSALKKAVRKAPKRKGEIKLRKIKGLTRELSVRVKKQRSKDTILILDFGSQYTQLIARRIREAKVFSQIVPFNITPEKIKEINPKGIILSGGPLSVYDKDAPRPHEDIFKLDMPVLGVCYGMQVITKMFGGKVQKSPEREFGRSELFIDSNKDLFANMPSNLTCWMSHGDKVMNLPKGFVKLAHTLNASIASFAHRQKKIYGVQFHPEVVHTQRGVQVLENFAFQICGCLPRWTMEKFVDQALKKIDDQVGKKDKVILGLSGGVDSSVTAVLLQKAIGRRLQCIFVDNGLLRKNEVKSVKRTFKENLKMNLTVVDAKKRFLKRLKGITDPEDKRKIIGDEFVNVFQDAAKRIKSAKFLAQGTLYPDVIESVSPTGGPSVVIKSHHNVGGLPAKMHLGLIEPLRDLFKDEVRLIGKHLGLSDTVLKRQPFPGPGLGIRIIGEVNDKNIEMLQEADDRLVEEIKKAGLYHEIWQTFAVLLPVKTVGVMGDQRTYENVIAIRAVTSVDGMTADWAQLDYELLGRMSNRIINEVEGVNRVVYDVSSKPPATIEWE